MIYTTIIHDIRKKLFLTCNEYIVANSIYNISNSKKYNWEVNKTYLSNIFDLSRTTIISIFKKLKEKEIIDKNEKITNKRTVQFCNSGWPETKQLGDQKLAIRWPETVQLGDQKLVVRWPETVHNIYNNNNNNNNIYNNKEKATNIYNEYFKIIPKEKRKYIKKSQAIKYLEILLKEYSEAQMLDAIIVYKKETDKLYIKAPQYFFSNSIKWKDYRVFEQYIKTKEYTKKKKEEKFAF